MACCHRVSKGPQDGRITAGTGYTRLPAQGAGSMMYDRRPKPRVTPLSDCKRPWSSISQMAGLGVCRRCVASRSVTARAAPGI